MHTKKIYVRENDGLLEDCQEITFLFDSNCKGPNNKVNKPDFLYQITTIEDFYSILQNDKKVLEHGGSYVFQVNTDIDLDVMLQSYQLFSFMIFSRIQENVYKEKCKILIGRYVTSRRSIFPKIYQNLQE